MGLDASNITRRSSLFQSTHPVRGGTNMCVYCPLYCQISIHPPRAGWDVKHFGISTREIGISIHPPRAGWDQLINGNSIETINFNPPTPCGVGRSGTGALSDVSRISIHPPRAGWDWHVGIIVGQRHISIHPPRAGWDKLKHTAISPLSDFNPPTPCGVGR